MELQMTDSDKPWHKHPLVWMIIAIPFAAVIMGVVMIWLAVDTDDGLVADDYYKQGLAINEVLSRDKAAAELGVSANIDLDNEARLIRLRFNKGKLENYPKQLVLHLQHATRANSDISIRLDHAMEDQYVGQLQQAVSQGIWYFEISDNGVSETGWKLDARTYVRSKNSIQLDSEYE
jgi:uncharacterized protein